jgi:hypothetical protein
MSPDFDTSVKLYLYRTIAATARIPPKVEVAKEFSVEATTIDGVFRRLREKKLVALAPDTGEIVMAPPFSATPTCFNVHIDGTTFFANCVWDAYGIAAALHRDAEISTGCGCCGEPMRMAVSGGKPVPTSGLAHFAVGGTISPLPEAPCFSSGRKSTSRGGARFGACLNARWSAWISCGPCRSHGMATD